MRKMMTLINREFWEQRSVFFNVPIILASIFAVVALVLLFLSMGHGVDSGTMQAELTRADIVEFIPSAFAAIASPFVIILWLIVFYYFLGSLYDDRKDGSVLFWQSMPISQTQTLASKLIAGLVLAPFCTWVVVMVTQVFALCIVSIFLVIHPVMAWTTLWDPSAILLSWLRIFAAMLVQGLWLLPLFAWCLLCSAFSKRAPALRALIPVILLVILEFLLLRWNVVYHFIISRFKYASIMWYQLSSDSARIISRHGDINVVHKINQKLHLTGFNWQSFAVGLLVSAVFIVIAAVFRRNCYDFDR